MGHTMSIHSRNEDVILEFGLKKPAFRIVVNTPTTHGAIGLSTGLDPAMTLGCGGFGGNITSDNISPRHLLNIKRLAYELRPAQARGHASAVPRPAPSAAAPEVGVSAMAQQVASYLASQAGPSAPVPPAPSRISTVTFVCEEDVREAIKTGATIAIGERTIVTPSARDLAQGRNVLVEAGGR
jgi:hypothetical protein